MAAPERPRTSKTGAAFSSMVASLALTVIKLVVGLLSGSIAVIAEAAHSGLDFAAAAMTLWAVRVADKPSDANHPYGHYRLENLSALAQTLLLLLTCSWILYEAVQRLLGAVVVVHAPLIAALVLLVSIVVDVSRARLLNRAATEHNSQALEADALHFTTDIFSSAAALLGVGLAWATPVLRIPWMARADAVAAIAIAVVTLALSWRLGRRTIRVLTDEVSPELGSAIEAAVRGVPGVHEPIRVRARQSGDRTFVDVIAHVRGNMPMRTSHSVADEIEEAVRACVRSVDVVVHLEPTGKHHSTHE